MEKLKEKFYNEIDDITSRNISHQLKEQAATSCAEITKDMMLKFNRWTHVNKWNYLTDMGKSWWSKTHGTSREMGLAEEELFNLYLEQL